MNNTTVITTTMVPAPSTLEGSLSAALRNGELAIRQRFKKTDPNHKNCFGNQHFSLPTSFGKIFGWIITGDLHATAYNLEQTLLKLLATKGCPRWQDCRPSSEFCPLSEPPYSLQSFLIGPDKEHASPHLTIITAEQWVAKQLKTCIMQSQILECFPRWGCLRLPAHVILGSGDLLNSADSGDARNDHETFEICVFGDNIPIHLDGVLVEVWKDEIAVGKATIGGFLTVGERILALSTAHSFSPPQQTTLNSFELDESDLEFLTDDLSSDDQSELDGISSSPNTSEYCCLQSCRASSPSTVDTGLVLSPPPQKKTTIGHLEIISRGYNTTGSSFEGLDWALIAITHPKIIVGNKLRRPQTGQGATNDNSSVEIVTSSRSINADIVSSAIFGTTRNMSPRSVLVANSGDINPGDSGSWCFSQRGSEALGMVLGNCQTINQCYLENMEDIKADIEAQIGVHVEVAPMESLGRLVQLNFLRFVDDQKCYGINGNDNEDHFITAARLKEFWSPKLISSMLNDSGLEERLDSDCVLENYIRIWSILVYINAHEQFKWFVDQEIDDTQLPIKREHGRITEGSRTFIEPFEANQGIFSLEPERAGMSSNISNDPIVQPARSQNQPKSGSATAPDLLDDIEAICSNEYGFSPLSIIRRLRDDFPKYFVSKVDNCTIDLPAFAGSGRAESTLEEQTDHVKCIRYAGEASSITYTGSQEAGTLVSKFKYSWNGTNFILFVLCFDTFGGDRAEHHFLLTPCDTPADEGGLHPKARELCLAAGQYASQTHQRALLLTNGSHEYLVEVDYKVWESFQSHRLTDVMDTATKEKLTKDTQFFFASRELFRNFNLAWKRSVLFHGPAGTGKTASIKALIAMLAEGEHLVPCIYVKFAEKWDVYAHNITRMFSKAREIAPCLLAIEDLDLYMEENLRGTFLAELDSELNDGILIIGSTQNLPMLHPALRARPGRFDLKYEFKLPGYDERLAFAKQWKSKLDENHLVDLPEEACELVANLTEGFNFTHLTDLFSSLLFYSQDTPTEGMEEQSEASEARQDLQNTDKYGEISSSLRQHAFAEVAMPPSLTKSHVAKFLRQQASVLLREIENESNASSSYNAYPREGHKAANPMKDSRLPLGSEFDLYSSAWSVAPMVNRFPGYENKAEDAGNAALVTTTASRDGSDEPCPGCVASVTNTKEGVAGLQLAENFGTDADADVSTDACPGCTRNMSEYQLAESFGDADASTDACPGCTRKAAKAAAQTSDKATDTSKDAFPSREANGTRGAMLQNAMN